MVSPQNEDIAKKKQSSIKLILILWYTMYKIHQTHICRVHLNAVASWRWEDDKTEPVFTKRNADDVEKLLNILLVYTHTLNDTNNPIMDNQS